MIKYIFCKIFKIIMVKSYMVHSDRTFEEIHVNHIPDIIYLRDRDKYYSVTKVTSEIINDIFVNNWISVEEIGKPT